MPTRTLIMVHGRGFKPPAADLADLWIRAMRAGVERDAPAALAAFDDCGCEIVYFGDENRAVLGARRYDAALDLADLRNTLASLLERKRTKDFRRDHYERLPGKSALKEFLADIGAPAVGALNLERVAVARFLPELADYWRGGNSALRQVDARLREVVCAALQRDDDVAIVSHCIGTVLAYNALWSLSRGPDAPAAIAKRKVSLWLTLGSPLGDESVKRHLDDAAARDARYPGNVIAWSNVSAEDDYVSHDARIADDYREMLARRLISRIDDARIYNLALRYGRSNPHNALGYLIHPRVSRALARWLGVEPAVNRDNEK